MFFSLFFSGAGYYRLLNRIPVLHTRFLVASFYRISLPMLD